MEKLKDITPLPSRAEEYDVLKTLGRGTYGHCYKVKRKDTNEVLVMKAVSLQGLSEKDREDTLNEAKLMKQLKHENLIRHVDSWSENHWLFIIMEHAEAGDLGHVVASYSMNKPTVSEEQLLRYIVDIGRGLQYLHDNRVLHRDIKPSNIFMVGNKAVIADLGLGRRLSEMTACAYSKVGTPLYFSPELCEEKPYNDKSDIWAFGCLIYELATGLPPFTAANQVALARKVVTDDAPSLPPTFSRDLQQLLRAMLRKAPEDRLSVDMVLGHPAVAACARRMSEERRSAAREQEPPKQPQEKWTPATMQRKFEQQLLDAKREMEREYEARLRSVVDTAAQKSAAEQREREAARLVESEKQIRGLTERCNRLQLEVQEATNERMVLASAKDYAERLQASLRRELEDSRRTAEAEQQALVDAEKMQRELIRVNEDTAKQLVEVQRESTELRGQLDMERREAGALRERLEELRGKEVLVEALQRSRAAREEELRAVGAELSGCKQQLRAQTSRAVRLEALVAVLRGGDDSSVDIDPNEAADYHMPSPPASENGVPEEEEKEEVEALDRAGQESQARKEAQSLAEEPEEEREEEGEAECVVPPRRPRELANASRSPPEACPTPSQPGLVDAEHLASPYEVAASPLEQLSAAVAELSPIQTTDQGPEAAHGRLQDLIDLASLGLSPIRAPEPEDRQEDSPLLLPSSSHQAPPNATADSQADLTAPCPIAPEMEAAQSKEAGEEAEKEDSLVASIRVMCNGGKSSNEQPQEGVVMPWMNLGLGDSFGRSGGRHEIRANGGSSGRSAPVHLQGIFKGSSEAEGSHRALLSSAVPLKATENQGPYDEETSLKGAMDAAAEGDSSSQQASFVWSLQQPMLSDLAVDDADTSLVEAKEVPANLGLPETTPDSADGRSADEDAVPQRSRLHELLDAAREVAAGNVEGRSAGHDVAEAAAVFHEPEDFGTSFDALVSAVSYAHPLPSREPSPPRRREDKEEEAVEAEDDGAALRMASTEEKEEEEEEAEELLHLGVVPMETFRAVSASPLESLLGLSPAPVLPKDEEPSEDLLLLGVTPVQTYRAVSAPPPESQLPPSPVLPGQQQQPQMQGAGERERPRTAQAGPGRHAMQSHRFWAARASRDEDERPISAALSAIAMAGDFVDDADLLSSDDDEDRDAAADGFGKRRAKKEATGSGAALRGAAPDEEHLDEGEAEAHVEAAAADQVHQGTGAGLARARAVNLAGLGVAVPEGMDKLAGTYFPVLLSWQRATGVRRDSQLRGTVVEAVWGNKERYKLSAGADSALEVLFRPAAGAGGHGVRKVMARRGSRPDFVRLEASPVLALPGGWRSLTAVVPSGASHGGRGGVSSTNAAGDLAEVILEFSRPNPADEVLVLRSESRLRQTLVAASEAFSFSSPGLHCQASDSKVTPPAIGSRAGSASPGQPASFRRTPGARSSLTPRDPSRPGTSASSARPRTAAKRSSTGSALSAEAVASPEPGIYSALLGQAQGRRGNQQQRQRDREPPASAKEQRVEKEAVADGDREWQHQGEYSEGDGGRWPLNSSQIALLLQRVEWQKNQKRRQSLDRAPGKEEEGCGHEEAGAEDTEAEETDNSTGGPSLEHSADLAEGMASPSVAAYQAALAQARAEEETQPCLGEREEEERQLPRASSARTTPPPPEQKPTDALMEKILSFNKAVASSRKIIEAVASPERRPPAAVQREGFDEGDEMPHERQPLCPMENNGDGAGGSGSGQHSSRRLSLSGRRRRSSSRGRGAASGPDAAVRQSLESTQLCQTAHSRQEQLFAAVRLLGTSQPRGSAATGGGRTPAGATPGASAKAGRRSRTPSRSTSSARLTPPN